MNSFARRAWAVAGFGPICGLLFVLLSFLGGCSSSPRVYAIPTHIDFEVATGAWSVATSGEGSAEQLPEWVGVYSTWQGERREGCGSCRGRRGRRR
jgi:hypothetical protein